MIGVGYIDDLGRKMDFIPNLWEFFGGENDDSPVDLGDFQTGFGFSEGDGMSKLIKQLGKGQGQVIPQ